MNDIQKLAKLIRYYSLVSTTAAGSGHPTSCLSAADIMATLFFGNFFSADLDNPQFENNDRFILSKGHAAPVLYAAYAAAGKVSLDALMNLRKFGNILEGHPTLSFPYAEVATGSLGQGLSVGAGMALNAKLDNLSYRTFVLLGDSEMSEGSVWEAMGVASHYQLGNLIAILDCNRLGQRGETMLGHNTEVYEQRALAFGWRTVVIDGHDVEQIKAALSEAIVPFQTSLPKAEKSKNPIALNEEGIPNFLVGSDENGSTSPASGTLPSEGEGRPTMIIARTVKGKGVSFLEDKDGWHGKALNQDELQKALVELGEVDINMRGEVAKPQAVISSKSVSSKLTDNLQLTTYNLGILIATRKAYGNALNNIFSGFPNMVVMDAEVSNSTYAELFKKEHPEWFFEMYIAEQNMIGMALGLSRRGKIPFISTFATFFSRGYGQIRMSQYSGSNIKFVGSHAGVSIGEDGPSQMALEDLGMFRSVYGSIVLYPSDAVSTEHLVLLAAKHEGNVYIRTTRKETAVLYKSDDVFEIGGSKTLKSSDHDQVTVIGAGVTLHEALAAYEELQKEQITIRVIDLYSIKPVDGQTLRRAIQETKTIITVEDHYEEGGIAEAVRSALDGELLANEGMRVPSLPTAGTSRIRVYSLAVKKIPKSGTSDELLEYEEINKNAIVKKVKEVVRGK
jgi:transketolase